MNTKQLVYTLYCLEYATERNDYISMSVWARDVADTINYLDADVTMSNERCF